MLFSKFHDVGDQLFVLSFRYVVSRPCLLVLGSREDNFK